MTPSQLHSHDIFLFFPFLFVCMWVFVGFIISRFGWNSFATSYPVQARPAGRAYNSPFAWFGTILFNYRSVVRVIFTDTGIYFYVFFLFRAFHSPFLVPWDRIKSIERKNGFFRDRYRIDIEDAAGEIHVILPLSIEPDLIKFKKTS